MSNVQVKNLDEALHDELRERAAAHGTTISDYVLELIRRELANAHQTSVARFGRRAAPRHDLTRDEITNAIDAGTRSALKVVDASAMVDVLVGGTRAGVLLAALDDDVFAPDLLVAEVFSALRRLAGSRTVTNVDQLAAELRNAPVEYLHTWPYAERMWGLRHNMSPYDASYIALAEDLGATLVTTDLRLAKAAKGIVPVISA